MKFYEGITPKLTLVFVLFAALLLISTGWLAYVNGRAQLQDAVTSELESISIEKLAALNEWVDDRERGLSTLLASRSVRAQTEALLNNPAAADGLRDGLMNRAAPVGEFNELFLMDPRSGQVILSTDLAQEGKFKENMLYFINGREGLYVQNLYYSIPLQSPAMTVAGPVLSEDGRLLAVLAGRLNLDELNGIIGRKSGLRATLDPYLINTSNLFVTQPRFVSDPAVLQRGVHTESAERCLDHTDGVLLNQDYRDVAVIAVYHWLPERELCLVVKMDQSEAFAPVGQFVRTLLLLSGLALAVASFIAYWLARSFADPVRQLTEGVVELGRGDLSAPIPIHRRDEIGRLANEFNLMAAALKEKEAQLSQRATELEASNKELEAFAYSVSHDLRAPLRAIDGFSRILLESHTQSLDAEGARYFKLVRDNARQMGQLVDDLLTFSRLGRQALTRSRVSPLELVNRVLEELRNEWDGRQVEFSIGELPECQADPALLKQVFVNLISNALKFTRTREVAKIEIGCKKLDGGSACYVKDNGVGFDMRYAHKLFGVFQRLHRADEYEGTGVGLAIVQRVIHRHGGRVWAESELDKGATFYFRL